LKENVKARAKGLAEEVGGSLKRTAGQVLGNKRMEVEGQAKQLKGEARQAAARSGERVAGVVEELTGSVTRHVGAAIDDLRMQAEGRARELKGQARQAANRSKAP
jgi:uncharacterized protein YjbJ (UPF0337 family)